MNMDQEQISELDHAYELERQRQRAQAVAKTFSPAIRDTPLCQAIAAAEAGMEDWKSLLQGWVEEQWILHRAGNEELVDASTISGGDPTPPSDGALPC